jgi:hypothetical protein
MAGRVEDWRHCSVGSAYPFPSFPLGVPHYQNREPDSSPRHIARSVRISRTTRSCTLHIKVYETYQTGATAEFDGRYVTRYSEKSPSVVYSHSLPHRFQPKPRR